MAIHNNKQWRLYNEGTLLISQAELQRLSLELQQKDVKFLEKCQELQLNRADLVRTQEQLQVTCLVPKCACTM